MLRTGQADLVLNDQRRAFSEEYVNLLLATCRSFIEVAAHSPLSQLSSVTPPELKNTPCILVAVPAQQETEQNYYQTVLGFQGEFLFAETLEEARLMVIGRKGFLPMDGDSSAPVVSSSVVRVPLMRGAEPILRNYCAFWRKAQPNPYAAEFAQLLQKQFAD